MAQHSKNVNGMRPCNTCGNWFPATSEYFYRNGKGLDARCKKCEKIRLKKQHEENSESEKLRRAKWRRDNFEHNKAYNAKWRAEHPESHRARYTRWSKANPEKCRVIVARRNARKKNLPDTFTIDDLSKSLDFFDYCCAYCGKKLDGDYHVDHYIPLFSENCPGTVVNNMLPACIECNVHKYRFDPEVWIKHRFPERYSEIIYRINTYFNSLPDPGLE